MDSKYHKKAFALIELLVVLAVIALLAGVLLPSLRRARETGRTLVCKTTLRAATLAHYSYFTFYNRLMPISVNDPVMRPWYTFDTYRDLVGLPPLEQEYKTRRIGELQEYKPSYPKKFICPAAKAAWDFSEEGLYPMDRSYGLNAHVFYFEDYIRRRMTTQSGEILCAADALDWWFNCWQCDVYGQHGEQWLGFATYGSAAFRHKGKANTAFWDGHVAEMDASELKARLMEWVDVENRR